MENERPDRHLRKSFNSSHELTKTVKSFFNSQVIDVSSYFSINSMNSFSETEKSKFRSKRNEQIAVNATSIGHKRTKMAFIDRVAATGSILFPAQMIFAITVHDTRVCPLTREAIPRHRTDTGVEHLNQFTDTHEQRRVFSSILPIIARFHSSLWKRGIFSRPQTNVTSSFFFFLTIKYRE